MTIDYKINIDSFNKHNIVRVSGELLVPDTSTGKKEEGLIPLTVVSYEYNKRLNELELKYIYGVTENLEESKVIAKVTSEVVYLMEALVKNNTEN